MNRDKTVEGVIAVVGEADERGDICTAESLRALAAGDKHLTFDEARQALVFKGTIPDETSPSRRPGGNT